MQVQLVHARLSQRDALELGECLKKLDAIHDSVNATGMAGKPAIIALCVEVYRAIERVLGKEIAAIGRFKARIGADQGNSAPDHLDACDAAAGAPGASESERLV